MHITIVNNDLLHITKSLYRRLFLVDISKYARVTKKMALPNLWQG